MTFSSCFLLSMCSSDIYVTLCSWTPEYEEFLHNGARNPVDENTDIKKEDCLCMDEYGPYHLNNKEELTELVTVLVCLLTRLREG